MINAKYTIVLKTLLDDPVTMQAITKSLSSYPLYQAKKKYDLIPTREELNKKLLNHYKYREIGFETIGRFLDELEITMCEIMPLYNERLKSIEIMADIEDPFGNVDFTETYEETRTGESSTNASSQGSDSATTEATQNDLSSNNNQRERKFSNTPQNDPAGLDSYLTEHEKVTDDSIITNETTSGSSSSNTSEATSQGASEHSETTRHTFNKKGNQGVNTYAHDMNEFRTSFIDVVNEIINDKRINELFMLVW